MAQQTINLGSVANDGTGDSLRAAGAKFNAMMSELYATQPVINAAVRKLRRGFANSISGSAALRIGMVGDSTTSGGGATRATSSPMYAAAALARAGYTVTKSGLFSNWTAPEISAGAGWSVFENLISNTANTNALVFTPVDQVDTFVIWYFENGVGTFSYQVDAGTVTNVNTTNTGLLKSVTVAAGSVGAHTLTIKWVSGTGMWMAGFDAYNSTTKGIQVINLGYSGSATNNWTGTNAYSPQKIAAALACDVYLVNLGINDWNNGMALATYSANLQTIYAALAAVGDVIFVSPHPTAGNASDATQQTFDAAIKTVAAANNVPVLDLRARNGTYTISSGLGLMADQLHGNAKLYADTGRFLTQEVLRL